MSKVDSYFNDFLINIRPTSSQTDDLRKGHKTLRDRLSNYDDLKDCVIKTFLQGSYKRRTAVKPVKDTRSDVDIVVVTNLSEEQYSPAMAIEKFMPFVKKYYSGKIDNSQSRSIGIELDYVKMDLVITSLPSDIGKQLVGSKGFEINDDDEFDDFTELVKTFSTLKDSQPKDTKLRIPDRDADEWQDTNPIEQIKWTIEKNKTTNGHYVNIVKAIKWWHRITKGLPKHPKSYPLEHMIGDNCPDNINSIAEGVTLVFESMVRNYLVNIQNNTVPESKDRGTDMNVLARIEFEEFELFYEKIKDAALLARKAFDCEDNIESIKLWRQLFGEDEFPAPPEKGGFSERKEPSVPQGSTYA